MLLGRGGLGLAASKPPLCLRLTTLTHQRQTPFTLSPGSSAPLFSLPLLNSHRPYFIAHRVRAFTKPLVPPQQQYRRINFAASMEQNGDPRSKRKQPPTPSNDRPMKQMRPETDHHQRNGTYLPTAQVVDLEPDSQDLLSANVAGHQDTAEWQKTIEKVVKNVVSIHFCQTCSFDTDSAVSSEATGFVVDAEKGYILTNRVKNSMSPCRTKAKNLLACRRRRPIHWLLYLR